MGNDASTAAATLGRLGGHARTRSQTPEELSAQGRKAAEARWAKTKAKKAVKKPARGKGK